MQHGRHKENDTPFLESQLLTNHCSNAQIARILGRTRSTIGRELGRNRANSNNAYRVESAHSYATARRCGVPRGSNLPHHSPCHWNLVEALLELTWSPEQISGRPAEVKTRETLGHWEGDTAIGSDRYHCVLTLVERILSPLVCRKTVTDIFIDKK